MYRQKSESKWFVEDQIIEEESRTGEMKNVAASF